MGLGDARPLMESSPEAVDIGSTWNRYSNKGRRWCAIAQGFQGLRDFVRFRFRDRFSDTTSISFSLSEYIRNFVFTTFDRSIR